jgi:phospholipid transport system substrate-binding protein
VQSAASTGFARFARGFAIGPAIIAGVSAAARPAAADESPAGFIRILGQEALAEMRSSAPFPQKEAYFHQMLRQDFDMAGISRFVLGPYSRVASAEQLQEFRDRLEDLIMRTEGAKLALSSGGDFRVTGTRTDPDGVVVTSQIISPQRAPIEMDWQLGIRDGLYKIEDVTIAGVSMALSYRSQIAGRIARNGGQVQTLLAAMRTAG